MPAGTGCRMNLVITHAVKPRKLITNIHGPQLTGLNRVTEMLEAEACRTVLRLPAVVIHIYVPYLELEESVHFISLICQDVDADNKCLVK